MYVLAIYLRWSLTYIVSSVNISICQLEFVFPIKQKYIHMKLLSKLNQWYVLLYES